MPLSNDFNNDTSMKITKTNPKEPDVKKVISNNEFNPDSMYFNSPLARGMKDGSIAEEAGRLLQESLGKKDEKAE